MFWTHQLVLSRRYSRLFAIADPFPNIYIILTSPLAHINTRSRLDFAFEMDRYVGPDGVLSLAKRAIRAASQSAAKLLDVISRQEIVSDVAHRVASTCMLVICFRVPTQRGAASFANFDSFCLCMIFFMNRFS